MKLHLCLGKHKTKEGKCIHSDIDIIDVKIPLFARSSFTKNSTQLRITCMYKDRYKIISKYITSCPYYQNKRLM